MTTPPPLKFGEHGELTIETINSANLTPQERERAIEMLEVQKAYLELFDAMSYPVDPEANVYDMTAMAPVAMALAWTLALNGFRRSGTPYIKKRFVSGEGITEGAHTWVDFRAPDTAEEELQPEHSPDDAGLPPDVRALAAKRDGAVAPTLPTWDGVRPKVIYVDEPRPDWMD